MAADFGLSSFLEDVPQINLGDILPSSPFIPGEPTHQPIVVNLPRAEQALTNKYSTYMRDLAGQYPPELVNALMDYDSRRVRSGQSPLSEAESRSVLDTALNKQAVTKEPRRKIGPTSILANAVKDIGGIVTALPQMPFTLAHEATQIGQLGQGTNTLEQVLNAPGVRLLPGTFTAAQIVGGTPGNLLRHPVITAMDLLPIANQAAKATATFGAVSEVAETARRLAEHGDLSTRQFNIFDRLADRPISTALNWRLKDNQLVRSGSGEFIDNLRRSRLGSFMAQHFGQEARNLMFGINRPTADANALLDGKRPPENAVEAVAKTAHDVRSKVAAIDPTLTSPGEMAAMWDRMVSGNFEGLTENQAAAIEVYREGMQDLTEWALKNGKNIEFGNEIYDVASGLRLLQAKRRVTEAETYNKIRNAVLLGNHASAIDVLLERLAAPGKKPGQFGVRMGMLERSREIQAGAVAPGELTTTWRGANQALKNAGYDTTILETLASPRRGSGIGSAKFRQAIQDLKDGRLVLPEAPTMTPEQVLAYTKANIGKSIGFRDVLNGINRQEWKGVTDALDNLRKEDPAYIRGVRNWRDTDRLLGRSQLRGATDEGVALARKSFDKVRRDNLAARFLPMQQKIVRDIVADELISQQSMLPITDQTPVERILQARDAGELADIPGFTTQMYNAARKEAAKKIEEMRANGFDPMFVHIVPVNRVSQSLRFPERLEPHTPASMRERMDDLTPGIKDFSIAINDMGLQFLWQGVQEARIRWVAENYGYSLSEVNSLLHEEAAYRAGQNPLKDYEGHKAEAVKDRFRALDPEEFNWSWGSPYINKLRTDKVYVPIEVYRNLKSLAEPTRFFGGVMDPVTKTFRIATTALSLRTQLYNIVGGAVATELMHPGSLYRYGSEAREMLRNPEAIPRDFASVIGSTERTLMDLDRESRGIVVEGVRKYLVGKKNRQWWDEVQARKAAGEGPRTALGKKFQGLVHKSYEFNGFFDNWYRATTYLAEYDNLLKKGYAEDVARYKAVSSARQVLQDYLGMTPFERNIVKSIIPFYGFLSHAARFVMRFPFDHPLRTEVLTKIALAEMERDDVMPNRFMSMLFFGAPDNTGRRHAFNLAPFNPFGDVANSMTLAGFLGNMNPIMQTAFEMVGLDRGQAELYPSLRYNPDTGRMEASRRGFLETALGNMIPQSGLLLSFAGLNSQYNEMLRRDPDQAARYLMGTLTVPILERQVNVPQEIFAAELARQKSQQSTLNAALKSGNWSEAMLYPSLQGYLDAVDALPEDQLQQFSPPPQPQLYELAQQAMSGIAPPTQQATTLDDLIAAQQAMIPIPTESGQPNPQSGLVGTGPLGLNGI